jgi:hypothetical protein
MVKRQGCRLVLDGAVTAAASRRSSTGRTIGAGEKRRRLRRVPSSA